MLTLSHVSLIKTDIFVFKSAFLYDILSVFCRKKSAKIGFKKRCFYASLTSSKQNKMLKRGAFVTNYIVARTEPFVCLVTLCYI